jgi:hypothetical protein
LYDSRRSAQSRASQTSEGIMARMKTKVVVAAAALLALVQSVVPMAA